MKNVPHFTPAASFILLSYNQESSIRDAVLSVLDQVCDPLEIILSDDASTDGTFDIIEGLATSYRGPHRIIARRNPENMGVNRHLECAIDVSSSDLMIWTAGDDISTPNRAARIIDVFRQTKSKLIFSDAQTIGADGSKGTNAYKRALFYRDFTLKEAALSFELYLGATVAWHKDLHRKFGGFPAKSAHEDLILGFRAAMENSMYHIPEELVIYREGAGVSNLLAKRSSNLANKERRIAILQLQENVLTQRLQDTVTFGLTSDHPVRGSLARKITQIRARRFYYEKNIRESKGFSKQPFTFIHSFLSEMLRDVRKR